LRARPGRDIVIHLPGHAGRPAAQGMPHEGPWLILKRAAQCPRVYD